MNLQNITINNVLGVAQANITATRPTVLVAGANGAGKSSIAEAVRLAVLGEPARGSGLKKDYGQLVHGEGKTGAVAVQFAEGAATMTLPAGKRECTVPHLAALALTMNPERFAQMDPKERRAALFTLMGVKVTPAVVVEKLAARGVDKERAKLVTPLLAAGFDSAVKEAQGRARDAKAAWRAVTGEQYGSEKARGWTAPPPAGFDQAALEQAEQQLRDVEQDVQHKATEVGRMRAEHEAARQREAQAVELQVKVDRLPALREKLVREKADLQQYEDRLATAQALAAGKKPGVECDCPECGVSLVFHEGALSVWTQEAEGSAEAAGKLHEYRGAVDLMKRAVANTERDIAAGEAAQQLLDAQAQANPQAPTGGALEAAQSALTAAQQAQRQAQQKVQGLRELKAAADATSGLTEKAALYHADVAAWDAIAEALGPSGIPADLLQAAVGPLSAALAQMAELSGWPAVTLDEDMNLSVGGRPYTFRSESEKWRADAQVAAALATVTGAGFMMLDRFDVLDAQGRADALYWLADLQPVSALVLGTLKQLPAGLGELGIQGVWIEGGQAVAGQQMAEAA